MIPKEKLHMASHVISKPALYALHPIPSISRTTVGTHTRAILTVSPATVSQVIKEEDRSSCQGLGFSINAP